MHDWDVQQNLAMNEMFKIARETTTATTENETKDGIERGPHTECSPYTSILSSLIQTGRPCLVVLRKIFEKTFFYIWSIKHKLITKIIIELVCKSRDESNEPN